MAQEAADMVLMTSDLRAVLTAIHLSRVIVRRIYLNLLWACAYNVVGIPLAAGLLLPWLHTAIPPYVAGAAMALSSVSVLASSLALKWYRPPRVASERRGHGGKRGSSVWSSFSSEDGNEEEEGGGDGGMGEEARLLRVVVQQADGGGNGTGAAAGGYGSLRV